MQHHKKFYILISLFVDNAKFQQGQEMTTMFAAIGNPKILSVQFDIHPTHKISISWTVGGIIIPDETITVVLLDNDTVKINYFIASFTKDLLGNHTITVLNKAITEGENHSSIYMNLKLQGESP